MIKLEGHLINSAHVLNYIFFIIFVYVYIYFTQALFSLLLDKTNSLSSYILHYIDAQFYFTFHKL